MSEKITPETAPAGTRILAKRREFESGVFEMTILEWSPSGARVRYAYPHGNTEWCEELPKWGILVERLPSLRPLIRRIFDIPCGRDFSGAK